MKKTASLLLLTLSIISCGPKKMKCYGKRCVETSIEKESSVPSHRNS